MPPSQAIKHRIYVSGIRVVRRSPLLAPPDFLCLDLSLFLFPLRRPIPPDALVFQDEEVLKAFFAQFGTIVDVYCPREK